MTQALTAAKQLLADLNDVLPIINVKGDGPSTDMVLDMKRNAAVLVMALTPVPTRIKHIVEARKKDMESSFKGLIETIPFDSEGQITPEQLVAAGAAAEMFASRCREFSSCLESYNSMENTRETLCIPGEGYPDN